MAALRPLGGRQGASIGAPARIPGPAPPLTRRDLRLVLQRPRRRGSRPSRVADSKALRKGLPQRSEELLPLPVQSRGYGQLPVTDKGAGMPRHSKCQRHMKTVEPQAPARTPPHGLCVRQTLAWGRLGLGIRVCAGPVP